MSAETEQIIARAIAWCVFGVLFTLFCTISGCVMHQNYTEPSRTKAKVELTNAENSIIREKQTLLKNLVDAGMNPIAARCAVFNDVDKTICSQFVNSYKKGRLD